MHFLDAIRYGEGNRGSNAVARSGDAVAASRGMPLCAGDITPAAGGGYTVTIRRAGSAGDTFKERGYPDG